MTNKTRFQEAVKMATLILWVIITGITCAGLWNAATQVKVPLFYIIVSIVLLLGTCVAAFFVGKKVYDYYGKLSIEETPSSRK